MFPAKSFTDLTACPHLHHFGGRCSHVITDYPAASAHQALPIGEIGYQFWQIAQEPLVLQSIAWSSFYSLGWYLKGGQLPWKLRAPEMSGKIVAVTHT